MHWKSSYFSDAPLVARTDSPLHPLINSVTTHVK
jgi:hypothetical protein